MSKSQGKDIWSLIKLNKDPSFLKVTQEEHERSVLFVGSRHSGKTSIIQHFTSRGKPPTKDPEPTIALDYLYDKRESKLHVYSAHLWELAGGHSLLSLLKEVVKMGNIHNTVFVIVLDLSKPVNVLKDLLKLLTHLSAISKLIYGKMSRLNNSDLPRRLIGRQQKKFRLANHPDKASGIKFSGVSTLIVANKFDIFSRDEPKRVKLMGRCLRLISHMNSCSLVYAGKGNRKGVVEMLNHLVYGTKLDEKKFISVKNEMDTIRMVAGRDQLANIKKMTIQKRYKRIEIEGVKDKKVIAWFNDFTNLFGRSEEEEEMEKKGIDLELGKYAEPQIDQMKKRMDEQFQRFKKELEREKRGMEKKKGNRAIM